MTKQLTITLDEEIYRGLHKLGGEDQISRFIENLVRPHVLQEDFEAGYRMMAQDEEREKGALEWSEGLIGNSHHEAR
jgi:predicted CopG family antitoxin